MDVAERVRDLVEAPLVDAGVELVDVELKGHTLCVFVDRPEGGIDLDALTDATQLVSRVLDEHDPVPGRYTLEVSSAGVERPLRTPAHFHRFVGTTVSVRTHGTVEGERRVEGELLSADDEGINVGGRALSYGDIERARTVFTWGPAPKPGSPQSKQKKKAASR
jgi:ribosome maturation factor RimP